MKDGSFWGSIKNAIHYSYISQPITYSQGVQEENTPNLWTSLDPKEKERPCNSLLKGVLMWFVKFLSSTIGKKMLMAFSGLCLVLFLCVHVAGNTTIFVGSEVFQGYADNLHSHPVIVFFFRIGLLAIFAVHIGLGITLWLEGRKEGKNRYVVNKWVNQTPWAMATMPYTGMFLFLFILVHVFGFAVAPGHEDKISMVVDDTLSNFFMALFYLLGFCALFVHLSHGFWSMLQTFGINHPRYNGVITCATYAVPGLFLCFFSMVVLYLLSSSCY